MEYKHLSVSDRRKLLESRLTGYETQHFTLITDLAALRVSDDGSDGHRDLVEENEKQVDALEAAHAECTSQLEALAPAKVKHEGRVTKSTGKGKPAPAKAPAEGGDE